mmetsp:Transcript_29336/g.86939  ORF Transcript_29336/g.86939 Transcript_29336/m.86939 type:complete len:330 (+) Transcript_29336:726-1715(+)
MTTHSTRNQKVAYGSLHVSRLNTERYEMSPTRMSRTSRPAYLSCTTRTGFRWTPMPNDRSRTEMIGLSSSSMTSMMFSPSPSPPPPSPPALPPSPPLSSSISTTESVATVSFGRRRGLTAAKRLARVRPPLSLCLGCGSPSANLTEARESFFTLATLSLTRPRVTVWAMSRNSSRSSRIDFFLTLTSMFWSGAMYPPYRSSPPSCLTTIAFVSCLGLAVAAASSGTPSSFPSCSSAGAAVSNSSSSTSPLSNSIMSSSSSKGVPSSKSIASPLLLLLFLVLLPKLLILTPLVTVVVTFFNPSPPADFIFIDSLSDNFECLSPSEKGNSR